MLLHLKQGSTMHMVFDDTPLHKANFIKLAEDGFTMALSFTALKKTSDSGRRPKFPK
jgi:hypothetical protein